MKSLEATIDELYRVPLDRFTRERNAAAKPLSGAARSTIQSLRKPPVPAWAVNQLHWKDKATYQALVAASQELRKAHRAALQGRKVDLHEPGAAHRAAAERAFAKTTALLKQSGARMSDATLEAIRRTLMALPADEPPGRLTHVPPAAGFSLLAGMKMRPMPRHAPEPEHPAVPPPPAKPSRAEQRRRQAAERELQRARAAAERARFKLAAAEQKMAKLRED